MSVEDSAFQSQPDRALVFRNKEQEKALQQLGLQYLKPKVVRIEETPAVRMHRIGMDLWQLAQVSRTNVLSLTLSETLAEAKREVEAALQEASMPAKRGRFSNVRASAKSLLGPRGSTEPLNQTLLKHTLEGLSEIQDSHGDTPLNVIFPDLFELIRKEMPAATE